MILQRRKGWLRINKNKVKWPLGRHTLLGVRSPNTKVTLMNPPDPTKAEEQTGIRYPTMLSRKLRHPTTIDVRQGTTSISLKPKGPDGVSDPPRGACSRTDNPRSTSPLLANPAYIPPSSAYPVKVIKVSKMGTTQDVRSRCSA